jgi:hypothetical protein
MWAGSEAQSDGLENLSFPQAAGVVTVSQIANEFPAPTYVVFRSTSITEDTCFVGQTITSTSTVTTDTFCVNPADQQQGFQEQKYMRLWNGPFPDVWPSGLTRFRVLVKTASGKVTEVNTYVSTCGCGVSQSPSIAKITPVMNGGNLASLNVTGQFTAPVVAVNNLILPIMAASPTNSPFGGVPSQQGSINIGPSLEIGNFNLLNDGNGVMTVCDAGWCSQTFFNPLNQTQTPVPGVGKG